MSCRVIVAIPFIPLAPKMQMHKMCTECRVCACYNKSKYLTFELQSLCLSHSLYTHTQEDDDDDNLDFVTLKVIAIVCINVHIGI